MRIISEQELKDILDKHNKWLRNEIDGERADLREADLSGADLSGADLRGADLSGADLSGADLRGADLRSPNLIMFQFQRHQAFYTFDGAIRIGCMLMPVTEWVLGFKEIGRSEGYTEEQIQMYGNFIKMCLKHFKGQTNE